jgi:hypothetical protein
MAPICSSRGAVTALSVAVSAVVAACSGSDTGVSGPAALTQPPVTTLTSIAIQGSDSDLVEGSDYDFAATCDYSDRSRKDCTLTVSWSATGPVIILSPGKVRALAPGSTQLSVAMNGKSASLELIVRPDGTPWDSLPVKLTEYEKAVMRDSILANGRVLRAMAETLSVWVSPQLSDGRAALDSANARWKEVARGWRIPVFVLHGDSASADVAVYLFPPIHDLLDRCAQGGPSRVVAGVVLAGVVQVSTRLGCQSWFFNTLTHELGHAVMGFPRGHAPGCNLMGYPCATWREWETETVGVRNETFDKIGEFLFSVPSGTKPR